MGTAGNAMLLFGLALELSQGLLTEKASLVLFALLESSAAMLL